MEQTRQPEYIDNYLHAAGKPTCEEDIKYLEYVANASISEKFDFEKYYWLSPKVKYDIVKAFQLDCRTAMLIEDPAKRMQILDAKLAYITGQLEEEHEFLMGIKDKVLNEYIQRSQYQQCFECMSHTPDLYDKSEAFKKLDEKAATINHSVSDSFKEMKKTSTILLIFTIFLFFILFKFFGYEIENNLFFIPWFLMVLVALVQKIAITVFRKKGIS